MLAADTPMAAPRRREPGAADLVPLHLFEDLARADERVPDHLLLGHRLAAGPGQELLAVVEPAAVHRPQLAVDAALTIGRTHRSREVVVQPDEVERRPDPGDAGDQVQPADQQVRPVEQIGFHAAILALHRSISGGFVMLRRCMTTAATP